MTDGAQDPGPTQGGSFEDLVSLVAGIGQLPPAERDAAIARFCREHADEDADGLRRAVEEALAEKTAPDRSVLPSAEERLRKLKSRPPVAGRYTLRGEVARGGMGVILNAYDEDLGRTLAMKVILGQDGEGTGQTPPVDQSVLARFLDEAQVTGQLDHPGVVPVHELGLDPEGRVYFTMRLVKGRTAQEVFALAREKREGWTPTKALEVFLKICDTLAYAHDKGVIHRDLKPSNVMVGRFGEVYVMDWGLAKVVGQKDTRDLRIQLAASDSRSRVRTDRSQDAASDPDSPLMTMDGAVVGTPSYMSPEQAEGRVEELDARTDVYAAGACLYTLLTGWQPYLKPGTRASPYTILNAVREGRPKAVHEIDATAPAELAAICERAMARDKSARYADTRALAEDLRAFLEGRVVKAHRTGAWAEMTAWVRRNRGMAAGLGVAALALVAGTVVSLGQARRAREREAEAVASATEASARTREARQQAYFASLTTAAAAYQRHEPANLRRFLDEAPAEHRRWEWRYLDAQSDTSLLLLRGHEGEVWSAVFSPDGSRVVTASPDKTARVWDGVTGRELAVLRGHEDRVSSAAFSLDGARVVTASADKTARVWDAESGRELSVLRGHEDALCSAAFSPDGARVVTASADKTARVWDAGTGHELCVLRSQTAPVVSARFSPDSARVVTASDKTVRIWEAETGRQTSILRGHEEVVVSARFSPDGARVVSASADRTARIWDTESGRELSVLRGHDTIVWFAAFSPDGTRVLTTSADKTARVWDAGAGRELTILRGHEGHVSSAAFSPDGARVVTASEDMTARVWDAGAGRELSVLRGHEERVTSAAFSPDGARVVTASEDMTARVWDAGTGRELPVLRGHGAVLSSAAFSPDGSHVVTASADARVWDAESGHELLVLHEREEGIVLSPSISPRVLSASFSPDGTRVVTAFIIARVWDAAAGRELSILRGHKGFVSSAAFSPDGARVVTASSDETARVWDASTGRELSILRGHQGAVQTAAFSPDGARIVTASADKTARVWDAGTGRELTVLRGHEEWVTSAAFSPEGARVVTASADETARIWNASTGRGLSVLRGHEERVTSAAFSPDGTRVVTASEDKTARVWDAGTGRELFVLRGHEDGLTCAAFSPDGTRLVTASDDKTARVWDAVPRRLRQREQERLRALQAKADRLAADLLRRDPDAAKAVQALRADTTLELTTRRLALDAVARTLTPHREEAWQYLEGLRRRLALADEVKAFVEADPALRPLTRTEARHFASSLTDDAPTLNRRAWTIVADPTSPEAAQRALRMATRAVELDASWHLVNTLGVAQFRCGQHAAARETLRRSMGLAAGRGQADAPADLAFLAMAEHQLGNQAEAASLLAKLEEVMRREGHASEPELQRFLVEARALIRRE